METDDLNEPNVQHLDVDANVKIKTEQEMKTRTPVKSYGLHTDVCVKTEQEMQMETSDESCGQHTDVCVKTEQEMQMETSDESYTYGQHTDHVCVKNEIKRDAENPVDVYVQQHSDSDSTCVETDAKFESDKQDDVLHPRFCDCDVNVKCEEKIKAEISSVTLTPLQEVQIEESCHVHKSDDGGEMKEDDSDPFFQTDTGKQMTNAWQIASGSPSLDTGDPQRSSVRTRVCALLEKYGFASVATESVADEIWEMLMNDTLESPDQLGSILGIDPSSQTTDVNTAHKQEPCTQEDAEPEIEIDVADTDSVGDLFQSSQQNLTSPTEALLDNHFDFDRLPRDENWRERREMSGVSGNVRDGENLGPDVNSLKCDDDDTTNGDGDVDRDSMCDLSGKGDVSQSNKDGHACTVCGKAFRHRSQLVEHFRCHTGDKPYKCTICFKVFGWKSGMQKHMRTVHNEDKPYKCTMCSEAFGLKDNLRKHIRNVHNNVKPYKCTVCHKAFSQSGYQRIHMRTVHNKEKPYKCTVCHKAFSQSGHQRMHMRTVHNKDKPYKCTVCSKVFGVKGALRIHMKNVHDKDKPYKCAVCHKAFGRPDHLRTHIANVHNKEKPYKCTVCHKAFGRRCRLGIHMANVHNKEKPYKCTVCHKAFGRRDSLGTHMANVHNKEKPYKCTVCHKAFSQSGSQRIHMRTVHNNDKPYKCTVCHKAFSQSSNQRTHMRTVHNKAGALNVMIREKDQNSIKDKPYKCTICCKAFGRKGNLQNHMRTVHNT